MKKAYKINLYSIPKDIEINDPWPKEAIILKQKLEIALNIIVVPTLSRKYYREILTNRLIPAVYYKSAYDIEGCFPKLTDKSEVFVDELDILFKDNEASIDDIKEYIERYKQYNDKNTLSNILDNIFETAALRYKEAEERFNRQKTDKAEERKNIKKLLKNIK